MMSELHSESAEEVLTSSRGHENAIHILFLLSDVH